MEEQRLWLLSTSCGGKLAGSSDFRMAKAKDGWEHMGTRDGKLVLRLSCIRVQFGEAAERRGGRLLL